MKKLKKFEKIKTLFFVIICLTLLSYANKNNKNEIFASKNENLMLIPSGQAVGMKLKTNGVMVVGTEADMPARISKIQVGDIITKANDISVLNTNHFEDIIKASKGEKFTLTLLRNGKEIKTNISAVKNGAGQLVMGLWLRDSAAGIGTISFYSADKKNFYALGHPINDNDTELSYDIRKGAVELVEIKGAKKGEKNSPGELIGSMTDYEIGEISKNTPKGIVGTIKNDGVILDEPMEVIPKENVTPGKAYIMSTVSENGVGKYEIEITKILNGDDNKDFIIKVTDDRLIDLTGGIVRGMSGSTIIRDGKIIGAVTHVTVTDPKKGFGIFIENMLDESNKIK